MIHVINSTANNSSNYVKQLPYKVASDAIRKEIEDNVSTILSLDVIKAADEILRLHKINNKMIDKIYS